MREEVLKVLGAVYTPDGSFSIIHRENSENKVLGIADTSISNN